MSKPHKPTELLCDLGMPLEKRLDIVFKEGHMAGIRYMTPQNYALQERIERLESALNKIAILGMGEYAYTSEFTELVNGLARKALDPNSGSRGSDG